MGLLVRVFRFRLCSYRCRGFLSLYSSVSGILVYVFDVEITNLVFLFIVCFLDYERG
jgi:hypothetical protein